MKAEKGKLVRLRRQRTRDAVQLVREELADQELQSWIQSAQQRLTRLLEVLELGAYRVVGVEPAGAMVLDRLREWLQQHRRIAVAQRPHA